MTASAFRWRAVAAAIGRVLLPQHCSLCGDEAGVRALCRRCVAELPRWPAAVCPLCALPAHSGELCGRCQKARPAFDHTLAVFDYAFPVDRLVHALKYRQQLSLAPFLGAELAAAGAHLAPTIDCILPMPLHPGRLAERGFNQAVEIARPLARASALRLELAAVRKLRDTPAQASLERARRLRAPRDAFGCTHPLDGQRVLVIDDVMTTGATLNELARCLKAAGAAWVGNLVLARTPSPG